MNTNRYGIFRERRPELVPPVVAELPSCDDGRAVTLFDADGTLYTDDVADDFTTWMIDRGHVSGDNWPTYMRIYRDDHPAGCRYLLSFYAGMTEAELDAHVQSWWDEHAHRNWVAEAVEAVFAAADKGYDNWILSGTPTNIVRPLCRILPFSEAVGMDFEVDGDGVITGRHAGISCAGEGKADKVASLLGDREVALGVGNGSLDAAMMRQARHAWSVYPNPEFEAYSRDQGWPILRRPPDFVEEEKFLIED